MKPEFWSIFFKMLSIGTIAASACLWADAGMDNRPKWQDEQTLIGGMIWSQLIILLGLLVSMILGEKINVYIHGYFLMAGVLLCFITASVLLIGELKSLIIRRREMRSTSRDINLVIIENPDTKAYISIGFISLAAFVFVLIDFIIVVLFFK